MNYLDPHIHMISRVTDDYHRMAQCGCVAVSEPAFWAGFDRVAAQMVSPAYLDTGCPNESATGPMEE